ncbi:MAG: hypothetical protein COU29_02620 [Candidatus Magasanikbacteria bacterium CG10_big_fil_rev_8_21_14_0_10_36_32]|uniref:Uncharacterized protein n=1 Tax=Candidatus Magasanikbacteria bacterium CG10_big_fil_rev_8_21_14_0_10_36_32 TaxID=1974646 RepID=A0A2M6W783_9BACT|nr:MAG: hypothetical protein COU29_02620 [Candidatus Magasanikbacteria bacterium CG10_big_fil_rev_8_21_14_0_10_36_32]
MSFDELKHNILDKSISDRQILKMYLSYNPTNTDDVFEIVQLLNEHRPAVMKLLVEGDQRKRKEQINWTKKQS